MNKPVLVRSGQQDPLAWIEGDATGWTAAKAESDHFDALKASGQWDNHCAERWFEDRKSHLTKHLYSCLNGRPFMWREASCYAASLTDLCLWAEKADQFKISWAEAKANCEAAELRAEPPSLKLHSQTTGDVLPTPVPSSLERDAG